MTAKELGEGFVKWLQQQPKKQGRGNYDLKVARSYLSQLRNCRRHFEERGVEADDVRESLLEIDDPRVFEEQMRIVQMKPQYNRIDKACNHQLSNAMARYVEYLRVGVWRGVRAA